MFEKEIKNCLKKLKVDIPLEVPPNPAMGDYALPCFQLAKKFKKSPVDIAKDLAKKIKLPECVSSIKADGPYLNFFLDNTKLTKKIISKILKEKDNYGKTNLGKNNKVVIDYSSPNIGKPFHIGHLRSTIIGKSLKLIHEFLGYKVIGINHLGDWGTQFGKLMYAHIKWGDSKKLEKNPTEYLLKLYVQFNKKLEKEPNLQDKAKEWFKKLEDNDKRALKMWNQFKSQSIKEFMRVYTLLNVNFDSFAGEAFYNDKMKATLSLAKKKGILKKSEGALVIELNKKMPPMMLVKSDGATTYGLRDLTAVKFRINTYKPKKIIYVVGSEQNLHFQQLFKASKKLGFKTDLEHVAFGMYLDSEGKKFATRKGKILLLDEVLRSTIDKAFKIIKVKNPMLDNKQKVAHEVGIGAVTFGDLMNDRIKDVVFDWDKILDFEGDTGPYLQYTHARACSILRKVNQIGIKISKTFKPETLSSPSEQLLIRKLMCFPEIIKDSCKQLRPHLLAQYTLDLAHKFNEFYQSCSCIKEHNKPTKNARLNLVLSSKQVIQTCLELLGLTALKEM